MIYVEQSGFWLWPQTLKTASGKMCETRDDDLPVDLPSEDDVMGIEAGSPLPLYAPPLLGIEGPMEQLRTWKGNMEKWLDIYGEHDVWDARLNQHVRLVNTPPRMGGLGQIPPHRSHLEGHLQALIEDAVFSGFGALISLTTSNQLWWYPQQQ